MNEIMNVSAVHNNGKPELRVGIRGKEFFFSLDTKTNTVVLKNLFTQEKLKFDVDEVIASNVYTKAQIDELTSGMMLFKGKYTNYQALLETVSAGIMRPKSGYVVFIVNGGGNDSNGTAITSNCHMIYDGERWQVL